MTRTSELFILAVCQLFWWRLAKMSSLVYFTHEQELIAKRLRVVEIRLNMQF